MSSIRACPRWLVTLLLAAGLNANVCCAELQTIIDRRTGTTLQVTTAPWILAFEQPLLAANARDYVALYAVEASNGGKRSLYVAAFFWSTVPGRNRHAGSNPGIRLLLDDREVLLQPVKGSLHDSGIDQWPLQPPGRDALLMLYPAEPGLVRHVWQATQLRARPHPDTDLPPELWFESWRSGTASWRAFAEAVIGTP